MNQTKTPKRILVAFNQTIKFGSGSLDCHCESPSKEKIKNKHHYECESCKNTHFLSCTESNTWSDILEFINAEEYLCYSCHYKKYQQI